MNDIITKARRQKFIKESNVSEALVEFVLLSSLVIVGYLYLITLN